MLRVARPVVLCAVVAAALAATPVAQAGSGGTSLHGPDVASYQHPHGAAIDWTKVKDSGATFAFVKATEGDSYSNPSFGNDYAQAHSVGLIRSAYHFARPHSDVSTAKDQARYFVKIAGTAASKGDLPLTLDLEQTGGLSPTQLVAWTKAFVSQIQSLTHRPTILYTYPYFWQHAMGNSGAFTDLPLWIASYRSGGPQTPLPGGWKTWAFWQYTSSGSQPGIRGSVDESIYAGSRSALEALANPKATPPPGNGGGGGGSGPLPIPPIHVPPLPTHLGPATTRDNNAQ